MKKLIFAIVCGIFAQTATAQGVGDIAVFSKNKTDPFFEETRAGADASAKRLGISIVHYAPTRGNNFQEQIAEVEDAITRKSRAMVFVPVDVQGLKPSVDKVKKAGIPIINFIDLGVGDYDGYVIYDDKQVAANLARVLVDALDGKGNIIVLEGIKGSATSDNRTAGAMETFKKFPGIKVLALQSANYSRGQALQVTENLMQQFPKIDGVFAASDSMGLAALEAFDSVGKSKPFVVSIDGTVDAVKSIGQGKLLATAEFSGFNLGCIGVELADKVANGKPVPQKRIVLKSVMITKANFDKFGLPLNQRKCATLSDLGL